MKNILGLDLGTNSIGWAFVKEAEHNNELSTIEKIGVRVNPLSVDEQQDFEKGKSITTNANRTLKRGARRNLDRYQDRRRKLINTLIKANIISSNTELTESGSGTTFETLRLRASAVNERIDLGEFARVLLTINKKRGYKSSRKAKNEEEGQAIDGMAIAKKLYDEKITPGQLVYRQLKDGIKTIPEFYRSDLQNEFDQIWNFQKQYYPEIFTEEFYLELKNKGQRATAFLFSKKYNINTADNKGKREEKKLQAYKWRSEAPIKQLKKEEVAFVVSEINNNLNNSSSYLGAISDRSKKLYFDNISIGEYLYQQIQKNPHTRLKNQVFYRQDYMDEFEKIWRKQSSFHPELTTELKIEIRDRIIFYQRKLKSQKGLISFCELEGKTIDKNGNTRLIGPRVVPRSSPLFQEFKIWQNLNNLKVIKNNTKKGSSKETLDLHGSNSEFKLDYETKLLLFEELNLKGNIKASKILEILGLSKKEWKINYTELEGNRTNRELYNAFLRILDLAGYNTRELLQITNNKDDFDLSETNLSAEKVKEMVQSIFGSLNINTEILDFNAELEGTEFERQPSYEFWHMLYSYEGDDSYSGNEKLFELLKKKFGFEKEYGQVLANLNFSEDYASLSSKAIRKIFPFIKENHYSSACELAGYRHSKTSLTKEELKNRPLKNKLELLKKNSLRQPVVEKILNQMINVVNTLIENYSTKDDDGNILEYFKFDEIRIELARELKKNAKERAEMTEGINKAKIENDKIRDIIKKDFPNVKNPTRNDIIRYKLYEELAFNAYKDLYTNTKIDYFKLYSKEYDIDHIIPQSRLFDDSFSNKVLVPRQANLDKGSKTAFDYMATKNKSEFENFIAVVNNLLKEKKITKAKHQKLLKQQSEIGDGFIERDLRESQYIAKKAKEILFEITRSVVSTSGKITNRLREDWELVNIMKELNLPKYRLLGFTEMQDRKNGQKIEIIKDWSKRNDHRHHAMDALTVAFTKHSHIQYLNHLNARKDFDNEFHGSILAIEKLETETKLDKNGSRKRVFKKPMPDFRQLAKEQLTDILVSHKAKNKVVTRNKNKTKTKKGELIKIELTPRGQLHKESVYGCFKTYKSKEIGINSKLDEETISLVANQHHRDLLLKRLLEHDNDPKKAFSGKNSVTKNPIFLNEEKTISLPEKVKIVWLENEYSIRKDINPDNFKNEKSIHKIIDHGVKKVLLSRLQAFKGNSKEAFSDLDKNPIWLNKEKNISIKRVKISGVKNVEALHFKQDHFGNNIHDSSGHPIPSSFVSTGNNHHVAVYLDEKGNIQENVISFFEAVTRINQNLPVIDKAFNQHLGWKFLYSMKQNEMFVFPNVEIDFNPNNYDLLDPRNKSVISQNLFRVQKFSHKDYVFRHHLETSVADSPSLLKGITWTNFRSSKGLEDIVKVRINHIGDIVEVGEYY